jgi:hypothetical protein
MEKLIPLLLPEVGPEPEGDSEGRVGVAAISFKKCPLKVTHLHGSGREIGAFIPIRGWNQLQCEAPSTTTTHASGNLNQGGII